MILISKYSDFTLVKLRKKYTSKVNWFKYVPIFLSFTIYILLRSYILNKNISISENFSFDSIIIVLFVGITEEMVFRGWLLNVTVSNNKKWLAIIINAIMFLAIHFPKWIYSGQFISSFLNMGFLCIIILSIIFSVTFLKSKNIIVPILLHMYWELLMFLFM